MAGHYSPQLPDLGKMIMYIKKYCNKVAIYWGNNQYNLSQSLANWDKIYSNLKYNISSSFQQIVALRRRLLSYFSK